MSANADNPSPAGLHENTGQDTPEVYLVPEISQPAHTETGRWSYLLVIVPYYGLLLGMVWYYKVILKFRNWRYFASRSIMIMLVLGLGLEWMADRFYVWSFPAGRDLFYIKIPLFGWIKGWGYRIPICELFWIIGVVPLFYYLWFWATLVFNDIIYVVDENGNFYKQEERWVGFHQATRILMRKKGERGQQHERVLQVRNPGFVSRAIRKIRKEPNA